MQVQDCCCHQEFIESLNFQATVIHDFFHSIIKYINDEKKFYKIYQIFEKTISNSDIFIL